MKEILDNGLSEPVVARQVRRPPPRIGVGSVLKQRYELVQHLGAGGMGAVFKARDLWQRDDSGRPQWVALKILHPGLAQQERALVALHQETRKTRQLTHPNVVDVHEFVCTGGTAFMVMEWLEGESLEAVLQRHPDGLPLGQALDLIDQLTQAIAYAHRQRIVHADLKPANLFLTKNGCLKVLDFGIARAAQDDSLPELTALTPAYASVHMLSGGKPRPVDDLYGLGCIAYLLLTGRHPFGRRRASEAELAELEPARIAALPSFRWRALKRLLQFRPRGESSLQQFRVQFFGDNRRGRHGFAVLVVLVALLGLMAVLSLDLYLWRLLNKQESDPVSVLQSQWNATLAATQSARRVDTCSLRLANQGKQRGARCRDGLDGGRSGPELVVVTVEGLTPFAITRTEMSRADVNDYCQQSRRCIVLPDVKLPAVGLTPEQIQQYVAWLSDRTGFHYRMPQLDEWLAVARDDSGMADHNCHLLSAGRLLRGQQLRPVEEGYANSFGLLNLFGNAEEWVRDGAAFVSVGGSHQTDMAQCNVGFRNRGDEGVRGFRLIRDLVQ